MEISSKQEAMIYEKLPKDIKNAIESTCMEISDLDKENIKRIFSRTQSTILDVLVGEYKYSPREVERITSDLFEEYTYKLQNRAEAQRVSTYVNGKDMVTNMSKREVLKAEENEDTEERKETLNHSYNNIVGYSEDIINEESIKAKKNYNYTVEDLILTELKSEIKRRMNVYDSRNAEEAFSEVSSILYRRMVGDLQESFEKNSEDLKKHVSARIDIVVTDFRDEYEKVTELEQQNKDDKKLDLSDMVATPEEMHASESKRLEKKGEPTAEDISKATLEGYFL